MLWHGLNCRYIKILIVLMAWFKLSLYSGFNSVHRRHGLNCRYIQVLIVYIDDMV